MHRQDDVTQKTMCPNPCCNNKPYKWGRGKRFYQGDPYTKQPRTRTTHGRTSPYATVNNHGGDGLFETTRHCCEHAHCRGASKDCSVPGGSLQRTLGWACNANTMLLRTGMECYTHERTVAAGKTRQQTAKQKHSAEPTHKPATQTQKHEQAKTTMGRQCTTQQDCIAKAAPKRSSNMAVQNALHSTAGRMTCSEAAGGSSAAGQHSCEAPGSHKDRGEIQIKQCDNHAAVEYNTFAGTHARDSIDRPPSALQGQTADD